MSCENFRSKELSCNSQMTVVHLKHRQLLGVLVIGTDFSPILRQIQYRIIGMQNVGEAQYSRQVLGENQLTESLSRNEFTITFPSSTARSKSGS